MASAWSPRNIDIIHAVVVRKFALQKSATFLSALPILSRDQELAQGLVSVNCNIERKKFKKILPIHVQHQECLHYPPFVVHQLPIPHTAHRRRKLACQRHSKGCILRHTKDQRDAIGKQVVEHECCWDGGRTSFSFIPIAALGRIHLFRGICIVPTTGISAILLFPA